MNPPHRDVQQRPPEGEPDIAQVIATAGQRLDPQVLEAPAFRRRMLRFLQAHMAQMYATTLACNHAKLETRLARWLLMCHDRVYGDAFDLTHERMAVMLGVRRAGVTVALHELEGRGYIRSTRGRIEIRDKDSMAASTDGFYGVPEAEYDRLVGAGACAR